MLSVKAHALLVRALHGIRAEMGANDTRRSPPATHPGRNLCSPVSPAQSGGTGHLWPSGISLSELEKPATCLLFSCHLTGWNLDCGCGIEWLGTSGLSGPEGPGSPELVLQLGWKPPAPVQRLCPHRSWTSLHFFCLHPPHTKSDVVYGVYGVNFSFSAVAGALEVLEGAWFPGGASAVLGRGAQCTRKRDLTCIGG